MAADIIDFKDVHSLFQKKKKQKKKQKVEVLYEKQGRVKKFWDEYEYGDESTMIPVELPLAELESIAQKFKNEQNQDIHLWHIAFIALGHLNDCVDEGMIKIKMSKDRTSCSIECTEPTKKPKRKKASK